MADRQKMDPVDLWMWIGAAVCLILSGAIALFLFGVVLSIKSNIKVVVKSL